MCANQNEREKIMQMTLIDITGIGVVSSYLTLCAVDSIRKWYRDDDSETGESLVGLLLSTVSETVKYFVSKIRDYIINKNDKKLDNVIELDEEEVWDMLESSGLKHKEHDEFELIV